MKKTILLTALAFAILQVQAQSSNESANDFFKSSQIRFVENLNQSEVKLSSQAHKIAELEQLSNSLKTNGELTAEKFDSFESIIKTEKVANELLVAKVKELKNSLSSLGKTKRNFTKFLKEVPAFTSQIAKEDYSKQIGLIKIEKDLRNASLVGEKKVMKVILADAGKQQAVDVKKIEEVRDLKENIVKAGTSDKAILESADARLQAYIKKIEDNAKEIKDLETTIANPEAYTANSVAIKARVLIIDSLVNRTAVTRAYSIQMLEENMKKSTKTLFSLAAFFGPGGYSIPEDKLDKAKTYFSPLVDDIIKFSNKYAQLPRTSTIVVNGYADASQITKGSKLYKEMAEFLKNNNPTKQELNIAISTLRAEKLSALFSTIIKEKSNSFVALPKIVFENIEVGRGEELPDATIKYKDNDERRRVVAVFWSVLPN